MRYVAAYLLAVLGGNEAPKAQDLKKILSSVGIDADDTSVTKVIKELSGKNIEELIASGREKLASVPSAGAVAASSAGAAPAAGGDSAPVEEKKEEKKEESDGSDDDMGFGLFD